MTPDIPDIIAGTLGVSRGTAYDMMRETLAEQYTDRNPLGGPAKVFDAMANAIRAGDDYHSVLRQYGFSEIAEPMQWVDLLNQAEEIVRNKSLWKKYIDGTPLANDIAVWMASFAQEHTATPTPVTTLFGSLPVYDTPQRQWVGLTDEEMQVIEDNCLEGGSFWDVYRAIEIRLKEKNT
jgi:hypothetical protein